jgi:hypothetical protein
MARETCLLDRGAGAKSDARQHLLEFSMPAGAEQALRRRTKARTTLLELVDRRDSSGIRRVLKWPSGTEQLGASNGEGRDRNTPNNSRPDERRAQMVGLLEWQSHALNPARTWCRSSGIRVAMSLACRRTRAPAGGCPKLSEMSGCPVIGRKGNTASRISRCRYEGEGRHPTQ